MVGQMVGWAPEHLAQPEVLALRVKSGLTGASGLSLERSRPQRIGGGRLQVVRIQPVERMLPVEASRWQVVRIQPVERMPPVEASRWQVVRIRPVERMLPAEEGLPKKVVRLSVRLACSAAMEECVERLHPSHRLQHR